MIRIAALCTGVCLDLIFGDPRKFPHIVVGLGKLISIVEKALRKLLPQTPKAQLAAGFVLVVFSGIIPPILLFMLEHYLRHMNIWLFYLLESFFVWQCLAAKSLIQHSRVVYNRLLENDLPGARKAVSMIVGRETRHLDEAGVIKATIESVAESASDGVIAPLFYLVLGGAPLGLFYKAVNTLDSMVGYNNNSYRYFGRASARLDDLLNFVPARLCALLTVAGAFILGLNWQNSARVLRRDHAKHKSPNSGWPESAFAGALGIKLGGNSVYNGELVEKPEIGDQLKSPQKKDILIAQKLMLAVAAFGLLLGLALTGVYLCFFRTAEI